MARGKVLASVAVLAVAGAAVWVAGPFHRHTAHAAALHGTIALQGCTANASDLRLSAAPVDGGARQVAPDTATTSTTTPSTSAPSTVAVTTVPVTTVPVTTVPVTTVPVTTRRTVPPTTIDPNAPVVLRLGPSHGTAMNTIVHVFGRGFGAAPTVHFGAAQGLRTVAVSDTEVDALAPPGTAKVHVTVTAGGLTSALTDANVFTYDATTAAASPAPERPVLGAVRTTIRRALADPPISATIVDDVAGTFSYSFPSAVRGRSYRLHADLGPGCKGARVRGPQGGYVVAGFTPIDIEAQLDGHLEVYTGASQLIHPNGVLRDNWGTFDDVWPSAGLSARIFHWSTGASKVASGLWQVSTQPLGDACSGAVGLVASGAAPFAPGALTPTKVDTDFTVDFAPIGAALAKPVDTFADAPAAGGLGGVSPSTTSAVGLGGKALGGSGPGAPLPQTPPVPQATPFTGNLYIRVLPLRADGSCAGPATDEVTISYGVGGSTPLGVSKLQVFTGGANFDSSLNVVSYVWGTALAFPWNLQSATFRWSTTGVGTQDGEWQLSTEPFVSGCADSPGLRLTGEAPFAAGPLLDSGSGAKDLADGHVFTIDFPSITEKGALTLYLRVVPRGGNAKACSAPPTNSVVLSFQKTGSGTIPTPPVKPTAAVDLSLRTYQPFAAVDPDIPSTKLCFVSIVAHHLQNPVDAFTNPALFQDLVSEQAYQAGYRDLKAGQAFCYTPPGPPDPSFLDQVVSFVSAVVSFPAQVYDLYKQVLPGVLGSVLTQVLGVPGCAPPEKNEAPGKCYQALVAAQDIGLAALGLPPSLPDIGAFLDDGEDELAGEIATQLNGVGIPADATVIKQGIDTAKGPLVAAFAGAANAAQGIDCNDHGVTWCAFDTGARGPYVTVGVTRHVGSSAPMPASVCVTPSALYLRSCAPMPALAAGQSAFVHIKLRAMVTEPYGTSYIDVYNAAYNSCTSQQLQPDEGCTAFARRAMVNRWEGDATNGSVPSLTMVLGTLTAPTEGGSVWGAPKVATTVGCGGNGDPPPAASSSSCG